MRAKLTRLLLPLLCAVALAGPGGGGARAQPTALTIWTRLPQEVTAPFFDGFRKLHPEIALQVENIPGGKNHINKLMAAVAANAPPDMTTLDVIGTAQFAAAGALMPLDGLIAERPGLALEQFSAGQVQTGEFGAGRRHYAVPFGGDVSVIYYNRDLFRAAGLDPDHPPRTWDQFVDAAKRLTAPPGRYGFQVFPGYPTMTTFYGLPYLWMAGGEVIDPAKNQYVFNSPAGARALGFLADLHLKHHVLLPSAIGKTGDADLLLDFRQRRVAMTFGGAAQIAQLNQQPVDFELGVFQHPTPSPDVPSTSFVGGDNVAIMASVPKERLPAAVLMLEYLTSAEGQRNWWTSSGHQLPVRKDMLADPYYQAHPVERALLAAYVAGHEPPRTSHYVEMQQLLRDAYQEVFLGQASPQEALDEAAAQANAIVRRTGQP